MSNKASCAVSDFARQLVIYIKKIIKLNSEWKHPPPVIIIKLKIDNKFVFPVWVHINSTDCDARSLFQYLANSFSITLQYRDGY